MLKPLAALLLAAAVSATPLAGAAHLIEKMQIAAFHHAEDQARSEFASATLKRNITAMR